MTEIKTVSAELHIEMTVNCPNDECDSYIDLLSEKDTNNFDHNDESGLLRQMFNDDIRHEDFECDEVTCSQCKKVFNVKGLE